jgi:hypothetical protein
MVLVRNPGGSDSGRKRAIRSTLRALIELGHEVQVVAVSRETEDPRLPDGITFQVLQPPHASRVLANVICYGMTARLSLNECLCWSRHLVRALKRVVNDQKPDLLIADTLRAFPLSAACGRPIIADLDDLLSSRYKSIRTAPGAARGAVLGQYRRNLPPMLRPAASLTARAALRFESRLLERREIQITRQASAVCLVSSKESSELTHKAGREVFWTPPAMPVIRQPRSIAGAPDWHAVHVGGLDFGPNLQAVRWFRAEVLPLLLRLSEGAFKLSIIGYCPPNLEAELQHPAIDLLGYVESLEPVLGRARMFVAPIISGTGLKIKILDAMARGMPVVATSKAVEGLAVEDRVHAHVTDNPHEFARRVAEVARNTDEATKLGEAGQTLIANEFSTAQATAGWRSVILSIQPQAESWHK